MNQEDKDQIVAKLRKESAEAYEFWKDLEKAKRDPFYTFVANHKFVTFSKLAEIFESLRAE